MYIYFMPKLKGIEVKLDTLFYTITNKHKDTLNTPKHHKQGKPPINELIGNSDQAQHRPTTTQNTPTKC